MADDSFVILTQQLSGRLEAVAGTGETLTAADVKLKPFQSSFNYAPDNNRFSNDQVADDIGQAPDFVSGRKGKITFGCPFKTSGVLGTAPAIGIYLEGMGLKKEDVLQITISAPAGGGAAFLAGSTYSATGGKTGTIEQDISTAGVLRYIVLTGGALVAADVITVGSTTATASGTGTVHSVKYSPRSQAHKAMTVRRGIKNSAGTASQDFITEIIGSMGTGTIDFAALDAARINMEFFGKLGIAGAGALFTGVTYEAITNAVLPKLINATIQLNGVTMRPSTIQFDFGNSVELDPDPSVGGGVVGYDQARILKREPKITIDPYRKKQSIFDDLLLLSTGDEIPFSLILGTTPNLIEISALKCQIREDTLGNRSGQETMGLTLHVVRNTVTDADFAIYFR